jgi:hypothetical protein
MELLRISPTREISVLVSIIIDLHLEYLLPSFFLSFKSYYTSRSSFSELSFSRLSDSLLNCYRPLHVFYSPLPFPIAYLEYIAVIHVHAFTFLLDMINFIFASLAVHIEIFQ